MAALLVASASPATGQGSPYVPLDDVAYVYIDALMARGELRQLASLERPYTVAAIRQALTGSRQQNGDRALRSYVSGLAQALLKTTVEGQPPRRSRPARERTVGRDAFGARLSGAFYAVGQSSGR
ncbi:MAG: hypothetical protein ACR2L6_01840, partial [Gemmatimonadaceae bacterium]